MNSFLTIVVFAIAAIAFVQAKRIFELAKGIKSLDK